MRFTFRKRSPERKTILQSHCTVVACHLSPLPQAASAVVRHRSSRITVPCHDDENETFIVGKEKTAMDALTIKLKKMLLSRNIVFQDKSIQFMIRSLKDPKQFDLVSATYLNADMVYFLCEPLLSINESLIPSICVCLWMLSKNNTFYERNDVLYTCNSLMRTLVFLIGTSDPSITDLIQLLALIIKKGGTNLQEVCNIPQVLTIVKMVVVNSQNLPGRCVLNAISILTYFLSCPSIELSNKLYNTSMSISKAICKSVTRKHIIDPHVVDITSNLSSSLLRLYSTITNRVLINASLREHMKIANLIKNVAWYMIKHITLPFVLKNPHIVNIYYKSYRKGIKSLISPFKENLSAHTRQNIAHHYAASKVIKMLYELVECNAVGKLAEELLFEMLFYLSSIYLEINCQWPGGIELFRNQMVWSLKIFPKTPRDICLSLMNCKNNDKKYSIIIFIYFYLLTSSNVENESIYLEPMCFYLCSIQNEVPVPIIKALLFNISISFVSHNAVNTISGLTFATKKLVKLLNHQTFDLVFTHHPALLYFLFAISIIPDEIQLQFMKLWILNLDDLSCVELEKFCLNNYKGKLCLLNVLINDTSIDRNKLLMGFNIIKKIILSEYERQEHQTLLIIWELLPIYIGSFCSENPDIIGVLNIIIKHKTFLNVLQNLCLFENNEVCFLTFNVMIKLCHFEKEETEENYKFSFSITLKYEYILNAMSRQCHNCVISSITLFQIIIQRCEGISYIVGFNSVPSVDFFKSVFMQLETIISQELDWVSDHAWECISTILSTTFLRNFEHLSELQIVFATDPWLNFLLTNLKSFSEKCLEFLHFWLTHFVLINEDIFTIRGVKTLCPSSFDKTLIHISITIVNQIYERSELFKKAKMIIHLVLKNKFLLSSELEYKMKNFLNNN